MSFISALANDLVKQRDVYDLSRISELYFFGLKETAATIDFVGLVLADGLNEREIVEIRDRFLDAVQQTVYDFGTRTYGRNPNGLLIFVFEQESPGRTPEFIRKQTRAAIFQRRAVIFSWTVDAKAKEIYTHYPWVNAIPPIYILKSAVFPGKSYIAQCLDSYSYVPVEAEARQEQENSSAPAQKFSGQELSPREIEQIRAIFKEEIERMPKYNLPNVTELKIFENIGQYVENQGVSDPAFESALRDFKAILETLQVQHPIVTENEAVEIIDAEFKDIQQHDPQRWQRLRPSLKRLWNGIKTGAIKLGEHFTDSTLWGKASIGFLEGFSEDVE